MFEKKSEIWRGESVTVLSGVGDIDLRDTFECGQAFRYERTAEDAGYVEYMTVVGDTVIRVGQRERGELIFFGLSERELEEIAAPYFALNTDYGEIRRDILSRTDSPWLVKAAEEARGIVILKQDPWEALFSFIVSQNNNIPRIRKIIRALSLAYGENLAVKSNLPCCPLGRYEGEVAEERCRECGACYSFPTPEAVAKEPEKMLPSRPGFRYKYLLAAAESVRSGECDLKAIEAAGSYAYTVECLKRIKGVGDKVASCAALFGFGNLEAFPIDVWMRRAIDEYFDGKLDPETLGSYAGVAQQYIFHYIRNLENKG